ncbi:MAG: hypothetical protein ABSD59_21620 [Terracidiphilus sp.]|jgi:hypothetical protein
MAQASENGHAWTQWTPTTAEERAAVREELEAILVSYHFRGSKRYPALLRYVVDAALGNRIGDLKERTLGVEVFGRDPGYDTNADPVVRVSAGEVRKRIAQYYHENGHPSRVQIELPLGSYAPEFKLRELGVASPDRDPQRLTSSERAAHPRRALIRVMLFGLAAVLFVGGGIAGYFYREASETGEAFTLKLWNPLFNAPRPVLIILGTTHPNNMRPVSQETTFSDHVTNPYHHVSVSIALALAHLTGVLENHKKAYEVKESPETSLVDIRSRPIVLVGAINNDWTMRLVAPLRYRFTFAANGVESIDDATNPRPTGWMLDSSEPYLSITADYAIVARFHDPTTEGPVLVIAGLGPYGTQAASEFVQSPQHLAELATKLPRGWENKNLEVVLKTNVIGDKAGPPILLTTYTW